MRIHVDFYPQNEYIHQVYQEKDRAKIYDLIHDDDYMSFEHSLKENPLRLINEQFKDFGYKQVSSWHPTITKYENPEFSEVKISEHEIGDKSMFIVQVFFVYKGDEKAEKYIQLLCAIGKELNAYLLVGSFLFAKPDYTEVTELLREMYRVYPSSPI